jgi:hypothetical protein
MSRLIQLGTDEMRVELKRICRKARRFIARNKGQTKAVFPFDLTEHPGTCLTVEDNREQRGTN